MPPELAGAAPAGIALAIPAHWRAALKWLAFGWTGAILLFAADWAAMLDQWWNSSTYNHILLIPLILGWLVWLRWPELQKLVPQAWWPGLVLIGGALLVWVAGAFAGFNLLRQAGAVGLLPALALLMLGPRVGAGLAFPLGYSLFLVPFGDELVPPLQMITAEITIALVQLSGIPARIEGVFIDTPVGLFIVAEACSGVKFLIAMIALGVLVGNVCFRSWKRRAGFMALCIAAPILANGVRAWGTIYAAQYVGVEKAAGIDHIIYGWVFFAVVIAAVLGMSWKYFDRAIDDPMIDAAALSAHPLLNRLAARPAAPRLALGAALVLVLAGQGWARAADALAAPLPARIELPMVPGWTRMDYARACGGSRAPPGPIIACWGAIAMDAAGQSTCSMRSMRTRPMARKPVRSAKVPCDRIAAGSGTAAARTSPLPRRIGCERARTSTGWPAPIIAPAICWPVAMRA